MVSAVRVNGRKEFANGCTFVAAGLVLLTYASIAELTSFHLIAFPTPGSSLIQHRISEYVVVWILFWSIAGWVFTFLGRRFDGRLRLWIIALIPPAVGLVQSFAEVRVAYLDDQAGRNDPWSLWVNAVTIAIPFLKTAIVSTIFLIQVRVWRKFGRRGYCAECDYDLTGNISGVCPECGAVIQR